MRMSRGPASPRMRKPGHAFDMTQTTRSICTPDTKTSALASTDTGTGTAFTGLICQPRSSARRLLVYGSTNRYKPENN